MLSGRVAFAGSRDLPWSASRVIGPVVRAAARAGASLAVGCCRGADHLVLSVAVPALAPDVGRLRVFAAFGPSGSGWLSSSRRSLVLASAARGVPVCWWAGGGLSFRPRARLARRSRAVVSWAGSGPGPGSFVCFLSGPSSRGSLRAAAFAASLSLFVLAFPVVPVAAPSWAGPPPPLASPAPPGRWSRVFGLVPGAPAVGPAWLWLPAQLPLPEEDH